MSTTARGIKAIAALLLFAAAAAAPVRAQDAPAEVTDNEVARYKSTAKKACIDSGLARGDPQERVDAFCGCMLEQLDKSMSRSEWQQAYFYSLRQQPDDERRVIGPHLSTLAACRPKP